MVSVTGSGSVVAQGALVDRLRRTVPFRHLDDLQLARLAGSGWVKRCERGSLVCRVGDESDGLHVVLDGRIRLSRPGPGGRAVELGEKGPGASFGEPSLLDPAPRSTTVLAIEPSVFFVLSRDAFLHFISDSPQSVAALLAGIGAELHQAQNRIFSDIVHEHALQVQLHSERYRSLAQLVAGIAHEVNTPLGIINTAASVLAEDLAAVVDQAGPVAEPIRDAIEAAGLISSNLARASRLVERFKSLSASSAAAAAEEVDVMEVVEGVLALFAPQARAAKLSIETSDRRAEPTRSWIGNPGYLAEVLLNLLCNVERHAYPAGAGGPVDVIVTDEHRPEGSSLAVVVRDRGRGIPAADLDRVWEPFFTTARAHGGTGLGLPVVNNLVVDGMLGTAEISSELGVHTTVRVCIPQQPPPPDR